MKASITVLWSTSKVAKRFDVQGKKLKGQHYYQGTFQTYCISNLNELSNLIFIIKNDKYKCLMLGISNIPTGNIVTKANFDASVQGSNTITRSLTHVKWHSESILMLDYDFVIGMNEKLKAENFEELYSLIIKVFPEFSNVEMLFEYSSSSFIYDKNINQYVSTKIGIHVYFMVHNCNTDTVNNFKNELKNRLIESALYYCDGNNEYYLFDLSVFSPEREIITSKPELPSNLAVYEEGHEMKIFNVNGVSFDLNIINAVDSLKIEKSVEAINYISSNTRLMYLAILVSKKSFDYKKLLALLDGYMVENILRFIGYQISNMKFRLRAENTASVSIMRDSGFINDFGGDFKGSIIDLLINYHNFDFKQAVNYLSCCFGFNNKLFDFSFSKLKSPYEIYKILYKNITVDYTLEIPNIEVYNATKKNDLISKNNIDLPVLFKEVKESVYRDSEPELKEILNCIDFDKDKLNVDKLYASIIDERTRVTIGYSNKYSSLAVILHNKQEVQTIAIRRNNSNKEEWTKWKKYGSCNYIPNNIIDGTDTVYIAFGMMEIILFEILGLSYVIFQSDDVARNFNNNSQFMEIIFNTMDKNIVIFPDNDESCKDVIFSLKMSFSNSKSIKVINFEEILEKELKKGYDLVDYVNENGLDMF